MDDHPVLGNVVRQPGGRVVGRVYTRTVVLWAVGLVVDPNVLLGTRHSHAARRGARRQHVAVSDAHLGKHPAVPVVRMATTATKRRGVLAKRLRKSQTFRSVLSLDVEYHQYMPNLKISARNTVQVPGRRQRPDADGGTGPPRAGRYPAPPGDGVRGAWLQPTGCGARMPCLPVDRRPEMDPPGFVGDVVLANVHFRLNCRLDRCRLRDAINAERGPFIASYEPLVRDVSVSVKHAANDPLPGRASVRPRSTVGPSTPGGPWITTHGRPFDWPRPSAWCRTSTCARTRGPHATEPGAHLVAARVPVRLGHHRFALALRDANGARSIPGSSGHGIAVARPCIRRCWQRVLDREFRRQRTLPECWGLKVSDPSDV